MLCKYAGWFARGDRLYRRALGIFEGASLSQRRGRQRAAQPRGVTVHAAAGGGEERWPAGLDHPPRASWQVIVSSRRMRRSRGDSRGRPGRPKNTHREALPIFVRAVWYIGQDLEQHGRTCRGSRGRGRRHAPVRARPFDQAAPPGSDASGRRRDDEQHRRPPFRATTLKLARASRGGRRDFLGTLGLKMIARPAWPAQIWTPTLGRPDRRATNSAAAHDESAGAQQRNRIDEVRIEVSLELEVDTLEGDIRNFLLQRHRPEDRDARRRASMAAARSATAVPGPVRASAPPAPSRAHGQPGRSKKGVRAVGRDRSRTSVACRSRTPR